MQQGALAGTGAPQGNKGFAAYKSATTGHIGGGSVGNYLAKELKCAGYDAVVLTGKAKRPVYLWIDDDKVEIRDAQHVWGKYALDTIKDLRRELGGDPNIEFGLIGPSGENLVRMAVFRTGFMNAQGKGGAGAVLASKNVKAIAVRGTQPVQLAHPDKMLKYIREYIPVLKSTPAYKMFSYYGTPGVTPAYANINTHNNFTTNKEFLSQHGPDVLIERYITRLKGCWSCPVHCKRFHQISSGPHAGVGSGPDVSMLMMCMQAGMTDADWILSVADLVNEYGIDWQIPMATMAWAIECFEKGVLTTADTDGLKLKFGDKETTEEMLHRMATRQGDFGNLLAEGPLIAPAILGRGSEKLSAVSKGLVGIRDPRLNEAHYFWWIGCPRGGGLQRSLNALGWMQAKKEDVLPLIGKEQADLFFSQGEKRSLGFAGLFVHAENIMALMYDSFGLCVYGGGWPTLNPHHAKFYHAATGFRCW